MKQISGTVRSIIGVIWILFCALVVITNYKPTGHKQLLFQFLGLGGILLALYIYNRKNSK